MKRKLSHSKRSSSTMKRIHNNLVKDIIRIRKKLQQEADKRYGKGKVKITDVFASKVLSARLRK